MTSSLVAPRPSSVSLWVGRVITALVVAFMIFDLIGKLLVIQPVIDAQTHLGFPVELSTTLGVIEIVCVALYVIPPTTWIGALLLTAYLGGATAIQVRVGDPFVPENAARLQQIAWALLWVQVLHLVFGVLAKMLSSKNAVIEWTFSLSGWLAVILLFVLARVFEEGARMRRDLEGTV